MNEQVMEEKLNPENIELASVTSSGYKVYKYAEVEEVVKRAGRS